MKLLLTQSFMSSTTLGGFTLDQVMSETKKDALEDPADDGAAIAGQESAGGAGRRNHPHS